MSNYNLVIDTTQMTPDEVAEEIIRKYNEWKILNKKGGINEKIFWN